MLTLDWSGKVNLRIEVIEMINWIKEKLGYKL